MSTPNNKSVIKAFDLIDVVCSAPNGVSLRQVADAAKLSMAAAHRILNTLKSAGALSYNRDGIYRLGPRLLGLHERNTRVERLVHDVVEAHMTGMLSRPAISVRLSILDDTEVFIFAGVDNGVNARMRSHVGTHYEAYCSAPGKVLLGALNDRKLDDYLSSAGFIAMTSKTRVSPTQLASEIKHARRSGYATDDGEFIENVRCVAVPVRSTEGQVVAALSVASEGISLKTMLRMVPSLSLSASALAEKLSKIPASLRVLHCHSLEMTR